MKNYRERVPTGFQEQVIRLNNTFEERTQEYKKQEDALDKRKVALDAISENLASEKIRLQEETERLEQREAVLKHNEETFANEQAKWKENNVEMEEKQTGLFLEKSLLVEELKTEKMKVQRELEEIKGIKEIKESGLSNFAVDPNKYILKEDIEQCYIEKEKYEKDIQALEEQRDMVMKEKTSLISKMLNMQKENEESELSVSKDAYIPVAVQEDQKDMDDEREGNEKPVKTEAYEDLTAEVLKTYLDKNPHGFTNIQILHSEEGEQVFMEKAALTCRFMFDEPARFDLSIERKEDRRLRKTLNNLNQSDEYMGIKFTYENGRAYAIGYFTSDMQSYKLVGEVERIAECFNE